MSFLTSKTYWLSIAFFLVLFIGNANLFGFPLILLALSLPIFFAFEIRLSFIQLSFILISTSIFSYKSFNLEEVYQPLYPLWVISFFLAFLFTNAMIDKLKEYPLETLRIMAFAFIPILIIFLIGIFLSQVDSRALFIFGPNMLYRIVGFFLAIGGGYLFFKGNRISALMLSLLCYYVLILIGSRGGLVVMLITLLLFFHIYNKKITFFNLSLGAALLFSPLFFLNIDLSFFRIFNFQAFGSIEDTDYLDAYSRLRPFLFLLFEQERFSIIGISHEEFLNIFSTPGYLYPHNMFLELAIYFGWLGVFVALITFYKITELILLTLKTKTNPFVIFCYALLVLFLGTMFSGDMGDNGAILGAIFAVFWHLKIFKNEIDKNSLLKLSNNSVQ